jgi:hypothetical protein
MRRVRIEQKARREKEEDRTPILPMDPRDPDILRVKRSASVGSRDKRL